jgi:hypothetical protein
MRLASLLSVFLVLVAAGCSSSETPTTGGGSSRVDDVEPEGVKGNVAVTWKNLNPRSKAGAFSLVNESSETARLLTKGGKTSTEIRVISDAGMAWLLDKLKEVGFFQHATAGLGLDAASPTLSKSGIVVVQQDGKTHGLPLAGPTSAKAYDDARGLIMRIHSDATPSFGDVKVGTGPADESIFSGPKIRPPRRP